MMGAERKSRNTSTPEVITFVVWLTYVVVALALLLRPVRYVPAPAKATTSQPVQP